MNRAAVRGSALAIGVALLSASVAKAALAADVASPMVRIAELEIDPAQIEAYKQFSRRNRRRPFVWSLAS